MKLIFTNAFGNKGEIKKTEIEINGKCVITNYDARTHSPSGAGDLTVTVDGENSSVQKGASVFQEDSSTVNMNDKKYSIFTEIAGLDGDTGNLTEKDLEKAKAHFNKNDKNWNTLLKLGVTEIRYDKKAGVATIVIGDNELLRIDFETGDEEKLKQTSETTEAYIKKCISNFNGGKIDIASVKDLDTVAKYTGISKEYIKNVLVDMEGHQGWPATTAYYDKVADKNHPKGHLTIGFGHTSLAGEPKLKEGMEITKEQAFQILANDIVMAEKICKNKLGKLYTDAPKSIQDAIIDIVFNKGPAAINESLKANLEKKYYHSATRRTWYETSVVGLQKRNMYRFLSAIRDLSGNDKENAVKNFKKEHLSQLQNVFKRDTVAKINWNNMCNEYNLKNYKID